MTAETDRLPSERLSPLAARVDEVLALYGYEMTPAIDAIDAAVAGYGGLFDPETTDGELRAALDEVLAAGSPAPPESTAVEQTHIILYVDGSSRGNPGPAGAGAVLQTAERTLAKLGRPVGARTDNNTAEYAALQLGLDALVRRCDPESVEIRIDSMTVIEDIWGDEECAESVTPYSPAITDHLATLPAEEWSHLADSDPNPADARATVGADIAELGPG